MKPAINHIGNHAIGFSIENIRTNYTEKETFMNEVLTAHPDIDKRKLNPVLERVWKEAFPETETQEKAAE